MTEMIHYSRRGIEFDFPEGWEFEEQIVDGELRISLNGPGTVFWTLVVIPEPVDSEDLVEQMLEIYRSEYPELDEFPVPILHSPLPHFAREVNFLCLDLPKTAVLRSSCSLDKTILINFQATDEDMEEVRELLEEMSDSVSFTDGDETDAGNDLPHDHDHDHDGGPCNHNH